MIQGVDYAAGPADPQKLKQAGVHFAARYLSTPGNPKNLTAAEARQLRQAGIGIVLVFEIQANRALGGFQRGAADARSARDQADQCGAPKTQPLYFAVDFDAQPGQLAKIVSYIRGAASVLGHDQTGIYGGYAAVKACLDADVCRYAWQTYAWSGGRWDPRAHLHQDQNGIRVAGIAADHDSAVTSDYGQWKPIRPKPAPKPLPAPKPAPAPVTPAPKPAPAPPTSPAGRERAPYWRWLQWRLGEGLFKGKGAANTKARPRRWLPAVPAAYWKRLKAFLRRRK